MQELRIKEEIWLHAGCGMEEYWAGGKGGYSRPHVWGKFLQLPPPTSPGGIFSNIPLINSESIFTTMGDELKIISCLGDIPTISHPYKSGRYIL